MAKTNLSRCVLAAYAFFALPVVAFGEERLDTALLGNRGVAWVGLADDSDGIYILRGVGDVDADGLDDFVIGILERSWEEPWEETPMPYATFLIYGRPRLSGDVPLIPDLERTWQVRGGEHTTHPHSHRVLDVAPAGDVEGDGYADFFLGYSSYPDNDPGGRGVLVHGGPDLEGETTLEELLESNRVTVFRSSDPRNGRSVGRELGSIGDFNGDGESDVGILVPGWLGNSTGEARWPRGAIYLLFTIRDLPGDVDIERVGSAFAGVRIEGFERGALDGPRDVEGTGLFGFAPLGDFNGDGLSDLALLGVGTDPNLVFVILGRRDPPTVLRLEEAAADPNMIEMRHPGFWKTLAAVGDLNGDGLADFAISEPAMISSFFDPQTSWVQVVFGSRAFPQDVDIDALGPDHGVRLSAVQENSLFGTSVDSAGDFDGDGRPDLVIGSSKADGDGTGPSLVDRGEAYILFSRDGFAEPSILRGPFPGLRVLGAGPSEMLGSGVAPAGDFDGDGFDDVLVRTREHVTARKEHPGLPRAYVIYGGPAESPFTLAEVHPVFGPASGGTTVRLAGSGFTPDARVFFGGVEASRVEFVSSSYLDVVTPPGNRGLADVSVTQGAETKTLESTFFYSPVLPVDLSDLGARGFTVIGPIGLGVGTGIAVGDFDGDRFDDIAFTACWSAEAENDGCSAVLVRGRRNPEDIAVSDLPESTTTFVFPDSLFGPVPTLIAGSPGDIDGDGIDDIFFAVQGGYGYVVFGRPEWPSRVELSALFEAGGVTEVVSPARGRMPVARLGDVDGDGIDDFAVTVLPDPLAAGAADPHGEIVFVAGRRSWENLLDLPAQASGRVLAGGKAKELGWEIVPAGDVNGDGMGDLLANTERGPDQTAYLIYGHPALFEGEAVDLSILTADPERATSFRGVYRWRGSSLSLSGAGDVNGDGFSDVLIGFPDAGGLVGGRSYLIPGAPRLSNLLLEEGAPPPPGVTRILGDGTTYQNAYVGRSGDLDSDGLDDFVVVAPIGFPPNPGHFYVLSGMETFPSEIALGSAGVESIRIEGTIPLGPLRDDIADSVGDFNGDGADDFVVRERGYEELPDEPGVPDLPQGIEPTGDRISIIFGLPRDALFLRGETNGDGTVDLADAVFLLQHLFASGERPGCMKAADTNDDGAVDLTDGIFLLSSLFAGGGELPAPHGACGTDLTPDDLSCGVAPACGR